jgi:hypothetical protein
MGQKILKKMLLLQGREADIQLLNISNLQKKRYILLTQYIHTTNQYILHSFLSTFGSLLQDTQEESKVHYLPQLIFISYGVLTYILL